MNHAKDERIRKAFTRTTLSPIVAFLALLMICAGSAWASPSVSIGAIAVSPSNGFNGIVAVCGSTATISVSVNVTATYDSSGTCLNLGGGTKRTATGSGVLTVTANGSAPSSVSGDTYTFDLAAGPEGLNTVTVNATATDGNTETSCTGSAQGPTRTGKASADYVTDQSAPTLTILSYAPGPVDPSPIPQVTAGEAITVHTQLDDGSSGTPFTVTLTASGPGTLAFTDSDTFGGPSGAKDNGKAPTKNNLIALQTSCSTAPGIYTMKVDADTQDLCGNAFATITKDPASTHDGLSGNDTSGTFEVLPPVSLSTITHVISEFPTGDYGTDQCFTSIAARKKLTNNPGSLHIAAIVTSTVPGDCSDLTISNPQIVLTLPAGFSYLLTGNSPAAHVFIGSGAGFDLHYPAGFTEVTDSAGIVVNGNTITIDLSKVDVGQGPGVIPTGLTIYARAHAIYSGPGAPASNATFSFSTAASANNGTLTASNSEDIVGNPSGGCVDGILP
jgi:hypothetical protein